MKRIAWVDDDESQFDAFRAQWPEDTGYTLEFWPLWDVVRDDGEVLSRLAHDPPDVLVVDWQEGAYTSPYEALKGLVRTTILKSVDSQDVLAGRGVYVLHPDLAQRTLQHPFRIEELKALLPTFSADQYLSDSLSSKRTTEKRVANRRTSEDPRRVGRQTDLSLSVQNAAMTSAVAIGEVLPLRYFNTELVPIWKSAAWLESLNRPESVWGAEAIAVLQSVGTWTQLDFGVNPADPEQFGLMQFTTYRLPSNFGMDPGQANFVQTVVPVSPDLLDGTSGGLSAYGSSVDGILALMRQAGFLRGRFYRVSEVSGLDRPFLELVAREPPAPSMAPLPAAAEMDEEEEEQFNEHAKRFTNDCADTLIYVVRSTNANETDSYNDVEVWTRYVPEVGITARLEVPVFLSMRSISSIPSSISRQVLGMFIFDLGRPGNIEPRQVHAIQRPLLIALKYFQKQRKVEMSGFKRRQAEALLKHHKTFSTQSDLAALESSLTDAALEMIEMDAPDASRRQSHKAADRSALFVRYDVLRHLLTVTADTDDLMMKFVFTLSQSRFILVQAALKALDAIRSGGATNEPIFVPDIRGQCLRQPSSKITRDDWLAIKGCDDDNVQRYVDWLDQKVATVVAHPLVLDGKLLGIMVVRSSQAFEFTRRRVVALKLVAESALPYLARLYADQQRREWVGLVMHEMRSHLSMVNNKLDVAINGSNDALRNNGLRDASLILSSTYGLANLFLRSLAWREIDDGRPTDAHFWDEIESYGRMCESSNQGPRWELKLADGVSGRGQSVLGRVLRVLIDNAFRYSQRTAGATVCCEINQRPDGSSLEVSVSNPGHAAFANGDPFSRLAPHQHVGLTLARHACADLGGTLNIENATTVDMKPCVIAKVCWPSGNSPA